MLTMSAEGRSLPESRSRVRPRNGLPSFAALFQTQADDADASGEAVHVSGELFLGFSQGHADCSLATSVPRLHPFCGNLSPRYQTSKSTSQSRNRRVKALRLRISKDFGGGRAECQLYLLPVLPGAGVDIWRDQLHHKYRLRQTPQ